MSDQNQDIPGADAIQIVMVANEAFALPLAVSLYSALCHLPSDRIVDVHIIDNGLSDPTRRRLRHLIANRVAATVTLHFESGGQWLEAMDVEVSALGTYSPIVLLRLFIPEMLPDTEKVLYLDCDIVVEQDVSALWDQPVGDHAVLGVQERRVDCPTNGVRQWRELGLDPSLPYVNSGVLVMNLRRWREEGLGERCMDFLRTHTSQEMNVGWDQEAINAVCGGTIGLIDPRWNVVLHYYWPHLYEEQNLAEQVGHQAAAVAADPYIIHFTSSNKPWRRGTPFEHPKRDRFFHYLRQSRWLGPAAWVRYRLPYWVDGLKARTRTARHRVGWRTAAPAALEEREEGGGSVKRDAPGLQKRD